MIHNLGILSSEVDSDGSCFASEHVNPAGWTFGLSIAHTACLLSVTVERTYKIPAVKGVFLLSEPCAANNRRNKLEIQRCTVTMETTIRMTRTLHYVGAEMSCRFMPLD